MNSSRLFLLNWKKNPMMIINVKIQPSKIKKLIIMQKFNL